MVMRPNVSMRILSSFFVLTDQIYVPRYLNRVVEIKNAIGPSSLKLEFDPKKQIRG